MKFDHILTPEEIDDLFFPKIGTSKGSKPVEEDKEKDYADRLREASEASNRRKEQRRREYVCQKRKSALVGDQEGYRAQYGLSITLKEAEEERYTNGTRGATILCTIWNNTDKKIEACVRDSYIINNDNEQHSKQYNYEGYELTGNFTIRGKAHIFKGDIFTEKYCGTMAAGWIYGMEIYDYTNKCDYDIQFELRDDGNWYYKAIDVSGSQ